METLIYVMLYLLLSRLAITPAPVSPVKAGAGVPVKVQVADARPLTRGCFGNLLLKV